MDQLQLMRVDFGSSLYHLFDEMCQMNTRIGRITRRQSRLSGFAPSSSPELAEESFVGGDDESDDVCGSTHDDEMTDSQSSTLCHS